MDISLYGEEISRLSMEMHQYMDAFDQRIFKVLKKLEKIAKEKNDSLLLGYTYYYYASAYNDYSNHEKAFFYIQKALNILLRCNDKELIARSYNIFAIEAQRLGCFSVAYQYYDLASSFVEQDESLVSAIITSNIGDLLTDMKDYQKANKYIKKCIPLFKKFEDGGEVNIVLSMLNLGFHYVHTKEFEKAKNALNKAKKLIKKYRLNDDEIIAKWTLLLEANISIFDNKEDDYLPLIIEQIINQNFSIYEKDTYRYCELLMEYKKWQQVSSLLKAFEKYRTQNNPYYESQYIQLMIKYCRSIGDKKQMIEYYQKRNQMNDLYRQDENLLYYESIVLMRMVDDLQNEQIQAQKENEKLQNLVEADALTGIMNRYGLTRALEEAFQRSYSNKNYFGVGVVDIDNFKHYNDVYGHLAGDECLKDVAKTLDRIAKDNNVFVARYGGDEFVFVYEGLKNQDILKIEKQIIKEMNVSVTHGFHNEIPNEDSRPWDFFVQADKILYQKKGE